MAICKETANYFSFQHRIAVYKNMNKCTDICQGRLRLIQVMSSCRQTLASRLKVFFLCADA